MIDEGDARPLGLRNGPPASAVRESVTLRSRAHHRLRTWVSERPAIYLPLARRKYPGPSPEVISTETQVVIDGYTRSASTFAVYAFQLAQERPVRMAHHLHAPAQLLAAARAGLPTIVVIREPKEAILSQLAREPDVALRDALWAYTRFYACLLPVRSEFVVADFEEITTDFGAVIRRVNRKFGTSYREFENSPANVEQCLALMKERSKLPQLLLAFESGTSTLADALAALPTSDAGAGEEAEAWVPSARRHRDKAVLSEQWSNRRLQAARRSAIAVYEQLSRVGDEGHSVYAPA